jgi:hypothetical protein
MCEFPEFRPSLKPGALFWPQECHPVFHNFILCILSVSLFRAAFCSPALAWGCAIFLHHFRGCGGRSGGASRFEPFVSVVAAVR